MNTLPREILRFSDPSVLAFKNTVFRARESKSGLRIGLRAVILQMSEKSKDRKIGWIESLRELIFLKMGSFLYIF